MEDEDEQGTWRMRTLMSTYTCHVMTTLALGRSRFPELVSERGMSLLDCEDWARRWTIGYGTVSTEKEKAVADT
jgi:hypothetical protein